MKILEFDNGDFVEGWDFSRVKLQSVNLFVGATGAGKSKMLNAIFGVGHKAVTDQPPIAQGYWHVLFEHDSQKFLWDYQCKPMPNGSRAITKEVVKQIHRDGGEVTIVERDKSNINFNGSSLPKLSSTSSVLYTLREESLIEPAFQGFKRIMRRNFFEGELAQAAGFQEVPSQLRTALKKKKSLETLFTENLSLSVRLFLLQQFFPDKFKQIVEYYKSIFPFIKSCDVQDLSQLSHAGFPFQIPGRQVPVFTIQESRVPKPIPYQLISSGMQKVLLIITDIMMLPGGTVYLIDEYENSLGINAINFLPSFLDEQKADNQIIITSHHPYLINAIPIKNWFVFNRVGSKITIKPGTELAERYGRSKQAIFTQLMNDPFYTEGVK